MAIRDDGGNAFPCLDGAYSFRDGMSLRDYFAAQALPLLSEPQVLVALRAEAEATRTDPSAAVAEFVYAIADAMLKERAK